MDWYRNLGLRAKLILGFIATAILTVLVGLQGVVATTAMSGGSDQLYREGVKGVRVTGQIIQHFGNMRQRLRDLIIIAGPDAQKINRQAYEDSRETVQRCYAELLEITKDDPDLVRLVSKNSSTFEDWVKIVDQAVEFAFAGKIQDAVQQMTVTAVPVNSRFIDELEEMEAAMDKAAESIDEHNSSLKRKTYATVIVVTLLVFVASILLGITISNMIVGSLDRISEIVQRVARGDLTAHFTAESKDELGTMAVRLEDLVNKIWEFVDNVKHGVSSVTDYATELSSSAEEISSTIEQISHSADTHKHNAKTMADAITLLSASVDKVSQGAQDSLVQLQSALSIVQQDNFPNSATEGAVNIIKRTTGRISQAIDVINEIAHQASLLSQNAALEATKAGEQGKRVAVAAEEIGKLAKRSAVSAKEITRRNLEARDSMERTGEWVAITVELLRDLRAGIGQHTTKKGTASVPDTAPGQPRVEVISGVLATTNEVAQTATELADLASELQQQIRRFKLTNKIE